MSVGYLLDTNVISMLFPSTAPAPPEFIEWLQRQNKDDALFLSVITIQEIEKGAQKLAHKKGGNLRKAALISSWLEGLILEYDDRILPVDRSVAKTAGKLEGIASANGYDPGLADILIAATATAYNLTVLTNNLKDFRPLNVAVESPETVLL